MDVNASHHFDFYLEMNGEQDGASLFPSLLSEITGFILVPSIELNACRLYVL